MTTPRKPRTRQSANGMPIELIPAEPMRRRASRTPPTSVMEMRQPGQPTRRDVDRVKARIADATVAELSKVSLADAATLIRAVVQR